MDYYITRINIERLVLDRRKKYICLHMLDILNRNNNISFSCKIMFLHIGNQKKRKFLDKLLNITLYVYSFINVRPYQRWNVGTVFTENCSAKVINVQPNKFLK